MMAMIRPYRHMHCPWPWQVVLYDPVGVGQSAVDTDIDAAHYPELLAPAYRGKESQTVADALAGRLILRAGWCP
jgi:hypothetical protein